MKNLFFVLLIFLTVAFISTNAFAQAGKEGFDLRIGLGADIAILNGRFDLNSFGYDNNKDAHYVGLLGKLEFGYRWNLAGIYLQQDLGGVFYTDDEYDAVDATGKFFGGTYVIGRGIYPIFDNFQIEFGFGLGVMYSGGKEKTRDLLFSNEDGKAAAAFAIKLGFSAAYYITNNAGIAFFLDYNYGVRKNNYGSLVTTLNIHNVIPGVQYVMRF